MPARSNYLLGKGENLTTIIDPPGGGGDKRHPYSFAEAKAALAPKLEETSRALDAMPAIACPGDLAVAALVLHPSYLAKSYYPAGLLAAVGLQAVGSRTVTVVPRKSLKVVTGGRASTTELFVAGPRQRFRLFSRSLERWNQDSTEAGDVIKIEDIRSPDPEERIKPLRSDAPVPLMEVALHGAGLPGDPVLFGFRDYLRSLGIQADLGRRLEAGSLYFLPVRIPRGLITEVARYSFLRVAREMPALRPLRPHIWIASAAHAPFPCRLPFEPPMVPDLAVAVFDGGLPDAPDLDPWARRFEAEGVGRAVPDYQEHGLAVTSALLFGPLDEVRDPSPPYARVDHYRVLDEDTADDPQGELYPVLKRILAILETRHYPFINLSIGPDLPVEDDDVQAWTTLLDPLLARGDILAAIAAGNSGEADAASGQNRVQPPADCINGLAVGACDSQSRPWSRSAYSARGPGRRPGRIKPDVLGFGGTREEPFWALGPGRSPFAVPTAGTSLASPTVLRAGLGVRAHLGPELRPLTIKAMLIHRSEMHPTGHDYGQHGWGRVRMDLGDALTCDDDTVHVVYQGELAPRQYLRAKVPVAPGAIAGKVLIAATICIGSATDPEHPPSYTRSGVDVVFRPNMMRPAKRRDRESGEEVLSNLPATRPFFGSRPGMDEAELREDGQKWEATLSAFRTFLGGSLSDPVFELHHTPRSFGGEATDAAPVPYAMIVTVRAARVKDFYNRVFLRYKGQLEPLVPILEIPVMV